MKVRKYLAVFLVAVMALTVVSTAGVIAAPKAAAQATDTYAPIQYVPGKTYTFLPWKYNLHDTSFSASEPTYHKEWSYGGTAYASIKMPVSTIEQNAFSGADVGMNLQLTNAPTDLTKPCKVTVTTSYKIFAKVSDPESAIGNTLFDVRAGTKVSDKLAIVFADADGEEQHGFVIHKIEGTLAEIFSGSDYRTSVDGSVKTTFLALPGTHAQGSAVATLYSITVTFPDTQDA